MASVVSYYTGDTVRVQGEFRNLSDALTDADGQAVTFKVYNADSKGLLFTGNATRSSQGIYYYDYTFPSTEQAYIFELSGPFNTKTQLKRLKVKAKFRV
jgi:hypothetical protein